MTIDWGQIITVILTTVIPILIPIIFTIPSVIKFFQNKSRREVAKTICIVANAIVSKYAEQGKKWAEVADMAIEELMVQLTNMGISTDKAKVIAPRAIAEAKIFTEQ